MKGGLRRLRRVAARVAAAAVAVGLAGGCDDTGSGPRRTEPPTRRVIEPPRRDVRALPPHVIAAGGVGPYKLGVAMERTLSALPSGPRLTVLQIPSVLDVRIGRDDGLIVGGERQGVTSFVAVLREGFARTADGIGVGARKDAVVAALGPPDDDPMVARDPALWVGTRLPNARFVFDGDQVVAVLLSTEPAPSGGVPPRCALVGEGASYDGVVAAGARWTPACLGLADGFAVTGEQVVIAASAQDDRPARKIATAQVPGLRWVAPVRGDGERDDLVAVAEQVRDHQRSVTVVALRPDGNKLAPVASVEAYRLTDQGLALIGATMADVDLKLEVGSEGDVLTIGGVFIHRPNGAVQVVAPLVPVTVRRTRHGVDDRPDDRERPDQHVDDEPVDAHPEEHALDGGVRRPGRHPDAQP